MGKLTYLIIHCTDTPAGRTVTEGNLEHWHMAPLKLFEGGYKYKGKEYKTVEDLPDDIIDGTTIKLLRGRGWDRLGYSDMLDWDGEVINLTPYDEDDWVQSHEMTWGASGINSISRHMVVVGGRDKDYRVADTLTEEQADALKIYVEKFLVNHPDCKVAGHYHFTDKKTCPNFDVEKFLTESGFKEKHIYREKNT